MAGPSQEVAAINKAIGAESAFTLQCKVRLNALNPKQACKYSSAQAVAQPQPARHRVRSPQGMSALVTSASLFQSWTPSLS